MATKDQFAKEYLQLKDVFADVFNFYLYEGKEIIKPQELRGKNTEIFDIRKIPTDKKQSAQSFRDLLFLISMEDSTHSYLLLGIEDQTQVHYALPIRSMLYDALQYRDQIKLITKKRRLEWQHAEQQQLQNNALKEFQKEDLLHPVITVVLYFGSDPWAGPRSVHDMLADLPPELLEFIPDYKLHLIELASLSDSQLQKFQSHLREVLFCLKHANHKEQLHTLLQDPQFRAIPYEAAALLNEFLGLNFDLTGKQKGDIISLCTAQDPMPPAPPCSTNEISS